MLQLAFHRPKGCTAEQTLQAGPVGLHEIDGFAIASLEQGPQLLDQVCGLGHRRLPGAIRPASAQLLALAVNLHQGPSR